MHPGGIRARLPPRLPASLALAIQVGVGLGIQLGLATVASPASAADPQQPTFPAPEDDTGIERPPPPDDRLGHLYIAPSFGVVGGTGAFGPNTPTTSLLGIGYSFGAIIGVGVGRYATIQVIGERSAFSAPGNCNVGGCSATSYAIGLGFTYHLTQALAFDPWASFGMAYRTSRLTVSQAITANVDGVQCTSGQLCPETYSGLDAARIAFGGDFYPTPWFGFGPFIEADIGTNLRRPVSSPAVTLPPNVFDGPRTYGFFQLGVRVALDPMRGRYKRTPATDTPAKSAGPAVTPSGASERASASAASRGL